MLRGLVLGLLLANAVFYAWTQGWLDGVVGVRAGGDREPERLALQVRPESIRILPATGATTMARAGNATPTALTCLEAGPFDANEVGAAEGALQAALPGAAWVDVKVDKPGAWIVYMGKFPDSDSMSRRIDELQRINIAFDEVRNAPRLEPGLSLGRYEEQRSAEAALAQLAQRGVRGAKVVELAPPSSAHVLRVERADAALAAQLAALRSDALGKGFARCARTPLN